MFLENLQLWKEEDFVGLEEDVERIWA